MPANRGVVSTGLYRFVRHPIYMGYLITHVGFVAANPPTWNLVVLVAADLALMLRAVCEEGTLPQDDAYRAYSSGCGGGWFRECSEHVLGTCQCYVRSLATVAPKWDSAASQNSSTSSCFSSAAWTMPRCTPLPRP